MLCTAAVHTTSQALFTSPVPTTRKRAQHPTSQHAQLQGGEARDEIITARHLMCTAPGSQEATAALHNLLQEIDAAPGHGVIATVHPDAAQLDCVTVVGVVRAAGPAAATLPSPAHPFQVLFPFLHADSTPRIISSCQCHFLHQPGPRKGLCMTSKVS
jgi:hypothetical protein